MDLFKPRNSYVLQTVDEIIQKHALIEPPIDALKILKHYTTIYLFSSAQDPSFSKVKGFTYYDGDGMYKTFLNKKHGKNFTNYTYAHELGRILLNHLSDLTTPKTSNYGLKVLEIEAHMFARNLTMPEHWIRDYVQSQSFIELCQIFNVPKEALEKRLRELKIQVKDSIKEIIY